MAAAFNYLDIVNKPLNSISTAYHRLSFDRFIA